MRLRPGNQWLFFLILGFIWLQGGCATVFSGTTDPIKFLSDPPGARVYIDHEFSGKTPLNLDLDVNNDYIVVFKMDGHPDQVQHLTTEMNMTWFTVNSLLWPWSLTWGAIDWITGAWSDIRPAKVFASFNPKPKPKK